MKKYIPKAEYDYDMVSELEEGKSLRLVHEGCGAGKNLSVHKDGGTVIGHCFKCKGIIAHKTNIPSLYTVFGPDAMFAPSIVTASANYSGEVAVYLADYGIMSSDMSNYGISICSDSVRMAFRFKPPETGDIAAVIRSNKPGMPKWSMWKKNGDLRLFEIPKTIAVLDPALTESTVILVEDLLSAVKVATATGENVVCTFGTSVGADEMAYLITHYDRFLVWYDYDPPGIKEGKNVTASLAQFADASQICESTRHGTDPKHFPRAAIRNIIKGYVYAK